MRLVSSKESVARGEVSILAIVETLLAIALVFYLSAHFNTLRWLAVAMCVSPLLLFRTTDSTRQVNAWVGDFGPKSQNLKISDVGDGCGTGCAALVVGPFFVIFYGFMIGMWLLLLRAGAVSLTLMRAPVSSFRAIPTNWARITLATDSFFAPEVIPDNERLSLENFISYIRSLDDETDQLLMWLVLVVSYLPAYLYRWSLKATSIIYAPLVFVAHSTFSEGADLRTKLELIKRGDLSRIRVWYGVIAIAAFLVKLVLMMHLPGFADWWNEHPVSQFLALYVAPAEIPKWQLAELANSVLAIGAMLFARHALLRYDLQHPWPEVPVKRLLGFVSGLRWVLALYAILCTGYITMRAAQHWHWPALGEQWLPW